MTQLHKGRCDRCKMAGLLQQKVEISAVDMDAMTSNIPESVPVLALCLECYNTPAGFPSKNEEHKRLPEAEYLIDKAK